MKAAIALRVTALAAAAAVAHPAGASDTTYEFTINWVDGQLLGTQSTGRFSFDSALVSPLGVVVSPNVFTDFDLTIRDVHFGFDAVTAPVITFNATGGIDILLFGTECFVTGPVPWGACMGRPDRIDSFFVSLTSDPGAISAAVGDGPPNTVGATMSMGTVSLAPVAVVPEPSPSAILSAGLVLLGLRRLRRGDA